MFSSFGEGSEVGFREHVRGGTKGTPCDFFLLFSYLNSPATPFRSWGADSWKYAELQSTLGSYWYFLAEVRWCNLAEVKMCQGLGSPVPRPGLLLFLPGGPVLNASLPFRMALHRPARLPSSPSSSWVTHLLEFQSCRVLEVYNALSAELIAAYSVKISPMLILLKGPWEKKKTQQIWDYTGIPLARRMC